MRRLSPRSFARWRLAASSPKPLAGSRPDLLSAQLRMASAATSQPQQDVVVKLRTALKESMKSKDKLRTGTIKSALADIQNAQHLSSPPAPAKTLRLAISRRIEASAASKAASPPRDDLASQYDAEAKVLEEFLPSRDNLIEGQELDAVIQKVIGTMEGIKEEGQKALGRVVKKVRDEVGDRAEGKEIAAAVKKYLSA